MHHLQWIKSQLRNGQQSSQALLAHCFAQIDKNNGELNALVRTRRDEAFKEAEKADAMFKAGDAQRPLEGVPVILKNNLAHQGHEVTGSSRILSGYHPTFNATAVQRLLNAGAIVIGQSNMDEFAMGSSNENSADGIVRNPWDRDRVPGGSSGGSAASVAAHFAPLALGSDTGGSIRQPAAFCGVTGLKPTYGRVSRYGLYAYGSSLDQIGPLTHCVDDAAECLRLICGQDPLDMTSVEKELPGDGPDDIAGLRIGVPRQFMDTDKGLRPEVRQQLEKTLAELEKLGATVQEVDLPILDHVIPVYYLIANCEASSNLARYDGVRYGRRTEKPETLLECYEKSRAEGFGQEVQTRVMLGTYALSAGYYDAYYKKAEAIRSDMRHRLDDLFQHVDVIAGPTTPDVAFRVGEMVNDPLAMYMQDLYTTFVNLVSVPALSLPCGTVDGLPVGMQLVGRHFDETTLFRLGRAVEKVRDFQPLAPL